MKPMNKKTGEKRKIVYIYAYNNKLKKIVRFERVVNLSYCNCVNLTEFFNNGWNFAHTLEEVIKETGVVK